MIDITLVSATSAEIHVRLNFGIVNPDRIKVDPSSGGSTLKESLTLNNLVSVLTPEPNPLFLATAAHWQVRRGRHRRPLESISSIQSLRQPPSCVGLEHPDVSSAEEVFRLPSAPMSAILLVPTLCHLHVAIHTGSRLSWSTAQILHRLHHHMAFTCFIPTHLHCSFTKFHTRSLLKLLLVIS